jgi:hypothetical protein
MDATAMPLYSPGKSPQQTQASSIVETQKIRFVANRPWLDQNSPSRPEPIRKLLPDWYRKADHFVMNPATGQPWQRPDGSKMPNWKACPAVFDVMGSGYAYRTPCDIEFVEDAQGKIQARVRDERYQDFVQERLPLAQFPNPQGYHWAHFAWWPDWAVELPEGYSALYTQPLNRFDLPFMTMNGIVDNDKVHLPGTMPFFVRRGFRGVLPAGTPYAQIIPFLREHWESTVTALLSQPELSARNVAHNSRMRQGDGGVYQREVWQPRKYE